MDLNLYRKKAALDRAMNGKEVTEKKFAVFAIHAGGYFTREPLCDAHNHSKLLDACVCANIKSVGKDMDRYGVEVEIVMLSGTTDFYKQKGMEIIKKAQIVRAFEKATTHERPSFNGFNEYGSCLHCHPSITEAAICANVYEAGRGYAPCGDCTKDIGAAIYSRTPCLKHKQVAGVAQTNGMQITAQEMYLGMRVEELEASLHALPEADIQPDIQPAKIRPDIQPEERRWRRQQLRQSSSRH